MMTNRRRSIDDADLGEDVVGAIVDELGGNPLAQIGRAVGRPA
jgi:hypothetical protein